MWTICLLQRLVRRDMFAGNCLPRFGFWCTSCRPSIWRFRSLSPKALHQRRTFAACSCNPWLSLECDSLHLANPWELTFRHPYADAQKRRRHVLILARPFATYCPHAAGWCQHRSFLSLRIYFGCIVGHACGRCRNLAIAKMATRHCSGLFSLCFLEKR